MDISKEATKVIVLSSGLLLNDEIWKYFGYKKRPLSGLLFSAFRSAYSKNKIKFLSREIFIFSASKLLLPYSDEDKLSIFDELSIIMQENNLHKSFNFNSFNELYRYLATGLNEYSKHDYDKYASLFIRRYFEQLKDSPAQLVVGACRLQANFERWSTQWM